MRQLCNTCKHVEAKLLAPDPETVKEVLVTIRKLAEEGMTCNLVTHEMELAREIGDHIYVTDRDAIVEHGPPATFFANASDPCACAFLSPIVWTEET